MSFSLSFSYLIIVSLVGVLALQATKEKQLRVSESYARFSNTGVQHTYQLNKVH